MQSAERFCFFDVLYSGRRAVAVIDEQLINPKIPLGAKYHRYLKKLQNYNTYNLFLFDIS